MKHIRRGMITKRNAQTPKVRSVDSTAAFLSEGYQFIGNACDGAGSDIVECRLMLQNVTCIRGPGAVEAFYNPGRFTRRKAIPATALTLLQDFKSVQTLDGEAHRHRKKIFMFLMTEEAMTRGRSLFVEEWQQFFERRGEVVLLDAASLILCRTILRWCGLSPDAHDAMRRSDEFKAMVAGAGRIGMAQIRGQFRRFRTERWAHDVIRELRKEPRNVERTSPAYVIAHAQDERGELLNEKVAAVELINLLRPTVAVARFIVFAGHGLHVAPIWRERVQASEAERQAFAQEVRRFYPFFPAVGGRVLQEVEWAGHFFKENDWVLLDIYGTDHHRSWGDPKQFRPTRFLDEPDRQDMMIAQGGGEYATGHRCAGERLTVELLSEAARLLAAMRCRLPQQDLTIPLNQFPTAPKSGFVMQL